MPKNVILVLVKDLLFATKISATAKASGTAIKLIRDPSKLLTEVGDFLIVDLNQDGTIPAAAEWRAAGDRKVLGFVSHVDAATISAAREAGIDRVIARSQFVQILPDLLTSSQL